MDPIGPTSGVTPLDSGKMTEAEESVPPNCAGGTVPTISPCSPIAAATPLPNQPEPGKVMYWLPLPSA